MIRWLVGAIGLSLAATPVLAADPIEVNIGYLHHAAVKSTLSLVGQPAKCWSGSTRFWPKIKMTFTA